MADATDPDGAPAPPKAKRQPPVEHRFKPGNPGKPKGARHKTTLAAEAMLAGEAAAITQKMLDLAKAGDMLAIKLCAERYFPVRRGRTIKMTLPPITDAASIAAASAQVVSNMAEGVISPEEAAVLSAVLENHRRALETTELMAELEVLKGLAQARSDDKPRLPRDPDDD